MSDLIERQAAIDALDFEIVHMTAYCDGKNEGNPLAQYNKGLEDGKKAIEALPSAQPEPKTALWLIRKWGSDAKCSNCGKTFSDVYDMDNHDRFCRFCGRKMIGVKGETK